LSRRTTLDLYAEILQVLKAKGGSERVTKLSYGVGMPVDRLKTFLQRLSQAGLIRITGESENLYMLTPRGVEFIESYWKVKNFLSTLEEQT
jgi:predicted transcriptional regulator